MDPKIGWSQCCVCGRPMRDADAVRRGIGPGCEMDVRVNSIPLEKMSGDEQVYRNEKADEILNRFGGVIPTYSGKVTQMGKTRYISEMSKWQLIDAIREEFVEDGLKYDLERMDKRDLQLFFREKRMLS